MTPTPRKFFPGLGPLIGPYPLPDKCPLLNRVVCVCVCVCVCVRACVHACVRACVCSAQFRDNVLVATNIPPSTRTTLVQEVCDLLSEIWKLEVLCDRVDAGQ